VLAALRLDAGRLRALLPAGDDADRLAARMTLSGPSTDTYRTVGQTRSTIRVKGPARPTTLTGRHRQSRDVRLGQEEFAIAYGQAAIRDKPEPRQRY
jgi:hypothetical protein